MPRIEHLMRTSGQIVTSFSRRLTITTESLNVVCEMEEKGHNFKWKMFYIFKLTGFSFKILGQVQESDQHSTIACDRNYCDFNLIRQ
jgi:hypothetical protein